MSDKMQNKIKRFVEGFLDDCKNIWVIYHYKDLSWCEYPKGDVAVAFESLKRIGMIVIDEMEDSVWSVEKIEEIIIDNIKEFFW
jgi:hypothetical protein